MAKVVTMGEILLRLSPYGYKRFIQAEGFDAVYGGSEANVAVSLANYGDKVSYITKLVDNPLGDAAVAALKKNNIDCSHIVRGGRRLGIYFLENGCSLRGSNVVYDREGSSMAEAAEEEFKWDEIFKGADLFHTSGITPVLSKNCAKITERALKEAKKRNILTSFDLNYRAKLWQDKVSEKQKIMNNLMKYVDICLGNARDAALVLGYSDGSTDFINGDYSICVNRENMTKVIEKYKFKYLFSSLRENISASDNKYSALVASENGIYTGKSYCIHIVDRVGTGDALCAGFLHGILKNGDPREALEFGIASGALKHTIQGDLNHVSEEEVEKIFHGAGTGKVVR